MECGAREFMKSLISIHDTECQIISFHGANARGAGAVNEKAIPFPRGFDIAFALIFRISLRLLTKHTVCDIFVTNK